MCSQSEQARIKRYKNGLVSDEEKFMISNQQLLIQANHQFPFGIRV